MSRLRTALPTVLILGAALTAGLTGSLANAAPARAATPCPAPGGVAIPAATATGEVVFSGHGWGHGMGMSQYGAQGAARLGCGYRTILGTYYRDARLRRTAMSAPVQLMLMSASRRSTVRAENASVRWAGRVTQPRGTVWSVVPVRKPLHGRMITGAALLDAAGLERVWVPTGRTLSGAHTGTVIELRSTGTGTAKYLRTRWDVARFTAPGETSTALAVTELITGAGGVPAVQKYLRAIAEVPVSWPVAAQQAQAVAARTYLASRWNPALREYRVYTTTLDQVYGGFNRERTDQARGGLWRRAVDSTLGQVLVDARGRVITAMYSSSMGGWTEDRRYVYGSYGISYLKAVDDSRWDAASDDPNRSWAVGYTRARLAARLGFTSISAVRIGGRGSAGRLAGLQVTGVYRGVQVTRELTGAQVRARLGLRSPGFVVEAG